MKTNQLKMGSILSYAQMGLSIVVGLAYTPIMIRLLGQSEYGLYNTVSSTISMLSILSLGFNSSYIRYFSKYKAENDETSIQKLNGLFLIIFGIIGLVALLCGAFLSFNLNLVFDEGLTSEEYRIAKILMLLLTVNLSISFPMSVFQNIISAHERFVFLKLLGMLRTVIGPLVNLPLLLLGHRSIALVTVNLILYTVVDIVYFFYARRNLKVHFQFRNFENGLFKSLLVYTSFLAINLIVDQINSNMGKFLLGRFNGTAAVAVYSIGYLLYQYYAMFSVAISGVFAPRIHRIVNQTNNDQVEQRRQLTEMFVKVGRVQLIILALVATGVIFFGKPFIAIWAGDGYEESYYVALLLMIPASIALIQNVGIEVQRALNRHQFRSIAYIIMAIINVIISVILCQKIGAVGAAIGTAISFIVANGLLMNIYYHKKCNLNILIFWKNILRVSLGLIIPIAVGLFITINTEYWTIGKLFGGILLYTFVYVASMWILGMNQFERSLIIKPMRRIFRYDKN